MKIQDTNPTASNRNAAVDPFLVIGGNGKTGRRVVARLQRLGQGVRSASRSSHPRFDWQDASNWSEVLAGVKAVYVTYHPDLSVPGASEHIRALLAVAETEGVQRIVLLSGRGEEEAEHCEKLVLNSCIPATIVRCAWFNQNFTESFFRDMLMSGALAVPNADVGEAYLDADDIAEVVTTVLTGDGHAGRIYDLTGPELLTFHDVAGIFMEVTGREVQVIDVSREAFAEGLEKAQLPKGMVNLVDYLFNEVLDGRNASLNDGVPSVLGRPPRDFRSFVQRAQLAGAFA